MLLRLLFFFFLAYILISLLKAYIGPRSRRPSHRREAATEEMVLDPQCQTYLPKSEALLREGNYFCSAECARLFLSR